MKSNLEEIFQNINIDNIWGDSDSVSGTGSNLNHTKIIRGALPDLLKEFKIKSMIDGPCGDYFWMKEIQTILELNLDKYIGVDIVNKVIKKNSVLYETDKTKFMTFDITSKVLPKVDLIFTRDCLVHLSFNNIRKVINKYKGSKSKYLMTTTFTERKDNKNIINGEWRPLNLQVAPFNFPKPILLLNENSTEDGGIYNDKCLGLWELKSLPNFNNLKILYESFFEKRA